MAKVEPKAAAAQDRYDLSKLAILVVDDNLHMRRLVRDMLHAFGVGQVHEAAEGGAALTILRQTWVDILICDWVMEPVDGFELTRMLRAASDVPNPMLPIIMMTGYTEAHRVLAARDAGITEMLAKPFSAGKLYQRLIATIEYPRAFIRSPRYTGPDRRRFNNPSYEGPDRRAKKSAFRAGG
ncbi:MAG: two-component system response regulator [Rhodospirillales bacterium]|jgi:two-component system chemotaxis response regulator CheY|nr:two-component system response regulator [Rhodospirillales bacterium]